MKVRIKDMVPDDLFPREIAEKLVGCEISLSTMANPDGDDHSELWKVLKVPEPEITHEVDVDMILSAIQQKHGEDTCKETADLMVRTHGRVFLMSTIGIPVVHCEVIQD